MFGFMDGYTTKIVAVLTIVFAIAGALLGKLSWQEAFPLVSGSLVGLGLRSAIQQQ